MLIVCGQGLAFGAAFGASWLIVRSRAASHRHVLTDDRGRFVRTLTWTQTRSLSRVVGTSWDMYGGIVPDVRRPGFWLLLSVSVASRLLGSRVSNFCPCSARPYLRSQTSLSSLPAASLSSVACMRCFVSCGSPSRHRCARVLLPRCLARPPRTSLSPRSALSLGFTCHCIPRLLICLPPVGLGVSLARARFLPVPRNAAQRPSSPVGALMAAVYATLLAS